MRLCRICEVEKPVSEFSSNGRKRAVENRCKACKKSQESLRNKLKKTAPAHNNCCDCCGKQTSMLCLDHDHKTETFRGWLCHQCNRGIGQLGDNLEGLISATRYLFKVNNG